MLKRILASSATASHTATTTRTNTAAATSKTSGTARSRWSWCCSITPEICSCCCSISISAGCSITHSLFPGTTRIIISYIVSIFFIETVPVTAVYIVVRYSVWSVSDIVIIIIITIVINIHIGITVTITSTMVIVMIMTVDPHSHNSCKTKPRRVISIIIGGIIRNISRWINILHYWSLFHYNGGHRCRNIFSNGIRTCITWISCYASASRTWLYDIILSI